MSDLEFIWDYVRSCSTGALKLAECGPVWQVAAIAALLCGAIIALVALRVRSRAAPGPD